MGITKRDSPISWRPSSEARLALAELMSANPRVKRNDLISRTIVAYVADWRHALEKDLPKRVDAGSAVEVPDVAVSTKPVVKPRFVPDQARIAAAQDWLKKKKS